ncbi:hypothetical protein M5K25_012270 [Dendrobium thyrsiflorum]|uniref:Isopropylmalate dehydrogenase-like domain-containing protein n=1 Tax=Dendrobium thyrsiflorum TaxID=117978 RepID=A0ABD0UWK9_DENTH
MAAIHSKPQLIKTLGSVPSRFGAPRKPTSLRCSAVRPLHPRSYSITLLPGDGIGPEVVSVAKDILSVAGAHEGLFFIFKALRSFSFYGLHLRNLDPLLVFSAGIEFCYNEMPMGGAAIDAVGVPLPEETLTAAKQSDAVLLGAIGGYKWDGNQKLLKPETGLLQLRAGLGVYANLRPATVWPQLVDSSTLKKEVAEGVDLVVIRELTGGIYFGEPRGFGTNDNGEDFGFNTEIYTTFEVQRLRFFYNLP